MGEAEPDEAIAAFHAVMEELAAHLPRIALPSSQG